ncbi:MAG: arsenate reductase ArsC [Myxococcota bacterium]|nr:arsenate reductase ArsC [Myxococcota bacterium]
MPENTRRDILFLCVANSARSQMAEGWARSLAPAGVRVHSAGSAPGALNPFAVKAMAEVDIDITEHYSKSIDAVPEATLATVITLCADEVCPVYPGDVEKLHWPFPDPADTAGSDKEILEGFRRVRDAIGERLRTWMPSTAS